MDDRLRTKSKNGLRIFHISKQIKYICTHTPSEIIHFYNDERIHLKTKLTPLKTKPVCYLKFNIACHMGFLYCLHKPRQFTYTIDGAFTLHFYRSRSKQPLQTFFYYIASNISLRRPAADARFFIPSKIFSSFLPLRY